MTLIHEALHQIDHLLYVLGGLADYVWTLDVETLFILEEDVSVETGDVPGCFTFAAHRGYHLVFTFVGIGGKVPYVGDVHHVLQSIAVVLQHPAQHVLEDVGTHIADMLVVVDGWAAAVHTDLAGRDRFQLFLLTREGVVNRKWVSGLRQENVLLPLLRPLAGTIVYG